MAFGIDDALNAATAGVKLTNTVVEIVKRYKKEKVGLDLELLLQEIKLTAVKRIDDADLALTQFERMLLERNINIDVRLAVVIAETPFWRPFEQHKLSQIRKRFCEFSDSIYSACDDIAALVRCHNDTQGMGEAVVESAKHELHLELMNAKSLREAIYLLRTKLADHKKSLDI